MLNKFQKYASVQESSAKKVLIMTLSATYRTVHNIAQSSDCSS